jgi:hypothetical protein
MTNLLITIVVAILSSNGLFALLQYMIQRKDKATAFATKQDLVPVQQAQLAIMQDRLEYLMTKYLADGEISSTQFKSLTTMLKAYEGLGGDDFIHALYDQCKELI